jgi:membrane associated rhomboid family serine protease
MSILEEIKFSIRNGSVLTRLIYINLGVFLFIHIVAIFFFLFNNGSFPFGIIRFLAVPADLSALTAKPWTLLSYMFLHKDFFHILFNLLWLYWFGKIFLEYIDQKRLFNVYILGGLSGAAFFIIAYNVFPALQENAAASIALGASASVMAIVIAIAVYAPSHTIYLLFFGPVKIIYIALISFILSSIIDISVNTGGKIAHIGGALFGYYFAVQYKGGKDISRWFSKFIEMFFSLFRAPRRKKMKVSYKKPVDDLEYNARKIANQKEIDAILDKISSKGYESLSKDEKETLFKSGQ